LMITPLTRPMAFDHFSVRMTQPWVSRGDRIKLN
jgi:hypothetical protein